MTESDTEWSRELSASDYAEYRRGMQSQSRTTLLSIEILDSPPEWERLRADVDRASRLIPRMRQHVVAPTLLVGSARWVIDPDMNLDYHLRRVQLPSPGSLRQLLDLAQTLHATPMDLDRPLWEATFVEGFREDSGESAAVIWKFSPPVMDARSGAAFDRLIHSDSADPDRGPMPPMPSPQDLSAGDLTRDELRRLPVSAGLGVFRGARGLVRSVIETARQPQEALHQLAASVGDLRQRSSTPSPSPLLRQRSLSRQFETIDVDLADLRGAARPHGYSVHDAYVAAVCGGLRLYHEMLGVPVSELSLVMPLGGTAGNRDVWSGPQMAAPIGEIDPVKRMRIVREAFLTASDGASSDSGPTASALMWLPNQLTGGGQQPVAADVCVISAAGAPLQAYLAGVPVDRIIPLSPLRGAAVAITMYSSAGRCHLGINVDSSAVSEPEALVDCLRRGFAEVIDSGRGLPTPQRAKARPRAASRRRPDNGGDQA